MKALSSLHVLKTYNILVFAEVVVEMRCPFHFPMSISSKFIECQPEHMVSCMESGDIAKSASIKRF